jgi:hypothetical protein
MKKKACFLSLLSLSLLLLGSCSRTRVVNHYLVYEAGDGGTVSGTVVQTIMSGKDGSAVTAVPNSGYSFVSWSDGVSTASRKDIKVYENIRVKATFEAAS